MCFLSSSKAAEFLAKSGGATSLVTASPGAPAGSGSLGPVLGLALDSSTGAAEDSIPPNIRLAMKKMSKKDAVTKLKVR